MKIKHIRINKSHLLIYLLLLSACNAAPNRQDIHGAENADHMATDYIDPLRSIFPLQSYSQPVDKWLPATPYSHIPILDATTQEKHFSALQSRYFGMGPDEQSPWNPYYIASILREGAENIRDNRINRLLGKESDFWGVNFKVYSEQWKQNIRDNASTSIENAYHPTARGIAIRETLVRALPSTDPAYGDPRQAGEGYPFDYLQVSSLRPGTPVYVLTDSRDKRWKYVLSPAVTGWVFSEDISEVDQGFVTEWLALAKNNLGAFINEPVSVNQSGQYYFTARPGTLLPFRHKQDNLFITAVPVGNSNGRAEIRWVSLREKDFAAMPWQMTPANIATLMKSMVGRPYGWGNYNFYNDCSAEMRSLLMPFGIFLPRNSAAQVHAATRVVDLSKEDIITRINYLRDHGKPLLTLVYISGHIMLYIGNRDLNGKSVPMTYQNIWGLHSEDSNKRSIIGGSVFFPLLASYPENPELLSPAGKEQFKLGFIE